VVFETPTLTDLHEADHDRPSLRPTWPQY